MLKDFISNLALMLSFAFLFDLMIRRRKPAQRTILSFKIKTGVLHGVFGIVLMFFSVHVTEATILDFRQIVIIGSAYFGGIYASVVASLIIAAGRVLLFPAWNPSSITAVVSALFIGIGAGYIFRIPMSYWRRWLTALAYTLTIVVGSLLYLLNENDYAVIPIFASLVCVGGLFKAYLIRYFAETNLLSAALKNSEEKYRALHTFEQAIFQSATGVSIIATELNGTITMFNRGAELMLGYGAHEVVRKHTPLLFHAESEIEERSNELSNQFRRSLSGFDALVEYSKQGEMDEREWTYIRKGGHRLTVNLSVTALKDESGQITGFLGVATDITERIRAEEKIKEANAALLRLSSIDGLTNIPNRRHFDETVRKEWELALRQRSNVSLIMLDIDYFKAYNDNYGHQQGDECLKTVASALKASLERPFDLVARYGGEEFAVILPGTGLNGALVVAERLRSRIEAIAIPHQHSKALHVVTVSLGVASSPQGQAESVEELILEADKALYTAKQSGRNRVYAETAVASMTKITPSPERIC